MKNPWEEIGLTDYENHMKWDSVGQLQALNALMKEQFEAYPAKTILILGVAGGNGLEHIDPGKTEKVLGVDINKAYLAECAKRHPQMKDVLELRRLDLTKDCASLPPADLLVADLLIEYIGCACFQSVVRQSAPSYVSCVIQEKSGAEFVSRSPYAQAFYRLSSVCREVDGELLQEAMKEAGYSLALRRQVPLPKGAALVRLDFKRQ